MLVERRTDHVNPSNLLTGGRALLASAFSRTSDEGMRSGGAALNANVNANAGASVVDVATGEPMHGASVIAMVRHACIQAGAAHTR